MTEYHKIETIFERDMKGNKKLIEGKFRNPIVEYLKGCDWHFTEKVDGTNIRIIWDGHKVSIGGRTDKAQIPTFLLSRLQELFLGDVNEQLFEQEFGEKEVVLYGEGFGEKLQKGGSKYIEGQDFILFDVRIGGMFLDRDNLEPIAKMFNIKLVPKLPFTKIQDAINFVKTSPKSLIGKKEFDMEGVIGVPKVRLYNVQGRRVIIKIKKEDFI